MYRNAATDMSPDRKVSTPQKYWEIIQPKVGNLSGAVPFQVRVDLTIMMVRVIPPFPTQIHQLHRGPMVGCNARHWTD